MLCIGKMSDRKKCISAMPLTQPSRAADEQIFPGKIQRGDCHKMGQGQAAEGMVSDLRWRSGRSRFGGESTQGGAKGTPDDRRPSKHFPRENVRVDCIKLIRTR